MRLSKRLQAIGDFVPKNSIVADIGTDHGYIPRYLIDNNISKMVIASDISYNSLIKTIDYVEKYKYSRIIPRVGDGLKIIKPFEIDTVILSGMGGLLIKEILDLDRNKTTNINNFILQPNIASRELRQYLYENNFKIMDENLVREDGKYYEIIFAKKGKEYISEDIYYEIGIKLIEKAHPLLREYLQFKIDYTNNIILKLDTKSTEKSVNRKRELSALVESYNKIFETL